jgi:cysteinyl-tRNA synthetase
MPTRFFNTYSRTLEEFQPRDSASRNVDIYTCGPTVYSRAHIGNFRAYVFEDVLQRYLELRDYKVRRVMNVTDVDDKTIRGAHAAKIPLAEFTAPFKQAFFEDIETLRIKRPNEFPAATEQRYVDKMIAMIGALVSRGLAYQADDKSVYYRINKFPGYGKLAHFDLTQLQSTGRVKNDEYDKEHVGDFALWKAWDEEDGDVKWDSPWGPGRPGWHIECSAMATAILGDQIDIHCGGVDNIFPHHEAEIAQTEGVTGKQFVRYWLHCAHLLVDGQKMSKSLGNFYTLPDLLEKGYSGREIRYALIRVHYRAPLNFTWEGMEEARQALARIDDWLERLHKTVAGQIDNGKIDLQPGIGFEEALDDDLNISAALGFLFESIRKTNRALDRNELGADAANAWLKWWERINSVLVIQPEVASLPAAIAALAEARMQARLAKDWRKSDELRDELSACGWEARDTKDGQKVTRRAGA